jgi:hypothetical protein
MYRFLKRMVKVWVVKTISYIVIYVYICVCVYVCMCIFLNIIYLFIACPIKTVILHAYYYWYISPLLLDIMYKMSVLATLDQRFSNFFQVGTTFISQNVLRTTFINQNVLRTTFISQNVLRTTFISQNVLRTTFISQNVLRNTFISQNVLRTALLLSPLKANCLRFSTIVCDTQFTLILFFLSFLD